MVWVFVGGVVLACMAMVVDWLLIVLCREFLLWYC